MHEPNAFVVNVTRAVTHSEILCDNISTQHNIDNIISTLWFVAHYLYDVAAVRKINNLVCPYIINGRSIGDADIEVFILFLTYLLQ